jgi:PAS domain S-box-containing protein
MLTELADDTAYGIMALHTRAERERAEQALRESEEKYRDILESISDLVQSVTPDGRILYVNRGWRETLGYTEEEVADLSLFDIIHPDSKAHCTEIFQRVLSGEVIQNVEVVFVAKDGKQIAVEGSASCKFEGDKPVATMGIFRDVTQRKVAEEAKRKLEAEKLVVERMKELDRIKSEFVSTVTHELRTPMTPLKSTIEMLLDGSLGELTDRQEKFITMMARNVERLAQFTTEVLTLSRLESGRFKLAPRMLALRETLEPVMELMEQKAQSKNSTVTLDIDAEVLAYGDADSLSIVVTNLTNNAIVHTSDGTTVTVSAIKIDENSVEIAVADNGQGIPKESLENLFDRFYQAKRKAGSGYQGTGVGLAVSKALIEAMGGEISVESHVGEGTVFRFTLPATLPQKDNEEAKE